MTTQAEYNTKLDTAAASDTLPDVAIINEDQIATEAFRHIIRPMDDVVTKVGVSSSDFPAAASKISSINGHQYVIPLSIVPMTMYYNADLLGKAGISSAPRTADDFAKAAAALTSGKNHGFQITTGFPVQQIFQQLLHQYGGTEFNADSTKATWNSPQGVQALQWMKDAQSKYSAPKLPVDADLNTFKAGTTGIIWNGIWQATNVTGEGVDFKAQAAAVPQIGPNPATWAGMASLALPVHKKGVDKCKDAASATFIKYLLDNSAQWAKAGNVPAYTKIRTGSDIKSLSPQNVLAASVENPVFPPATPGISDAFAPLSDGIGAVMSGTTTDIKKALDSAANRSDQILAQNKQKYGSAPTNS
jgi:multiple sugar transport system substrate-binding protein